MPLSLAADDIKSTIHAPAVFGRKSETVKMSCSRSSLQEYSTDALKHKSLCV